MTLTVEQIIKEAESKIQSDAKEALEKTGSNVVAELIAARKESGLSKEAFEAKPAIDAVKKIGKGILANHGVRNAALGTAAGTAIGAAVGGKEHRLSGAVKGGLLGGAVGTSLSAIPREATAVRKVMDAAGITKKTKSFKKTDHFFKTVIKENTPGVPSAPGPIDALKAKMSNAAAKVRDTFKKPETQHAFDPSFVQRTKSFEKTGAIDFKALLAGAKKVGTGLMANNGLRNMAIGAGTGVVGGAISGGKGHRLGGAVTGGLLGTAAGAATSAAPSIKSFFPVKPVTIPAISAS